MSKRGRAKSSTVGSVCVFGRVYRGIFGFLCACVFSLSVLLGTGASNATAAEPCPNESIRQEQASTNLPDCRAYEKVSPEFEQGRGASAGPASITDDGDQIAFSGGLLPGGPSFNSVFNTYVATRSSAAGWVVGDWLIPPVDRSFGASPVVSADLTTGLKPTWTVAQLSNGKSQFFRATPAGGWVPASPLLVPLTGETLAFREDVVLGGTPDLSRFAFVRLAATVTGTHTEQQTTFLPGDPVPVNANQGNAGWPNLYLVSGATTGNPTLSLVNRDTYGGGSVIGSACGAELGSVTAANGSSILSGHSARHAISGDGTTIYFTARPAATNPGTRTRCTAAGLGEASPTDPPAPARVFANREGQPIVEVSQSVCNRPVADPCAGPVNVDDFFEGASVDGSRVFFTTTRQLTDSDHDSTNDLYSYDFDPPVGSPHLVQVSRGDLGVGLAGGNGAQVQGVVRLSEDGSRAYFVAAGVLTDEPNAAGTLPTAGGKNLYVWRRDAGNPAGTIAFIATLAAGDSADWAARDTRPVWAVPMLGRDAAGREVGGDGHVLVFPSTGGLTGGVPAGTSELYRYVDSTTGPGHLERLTRDGTTGDPKATSPVELSFLEGMTSSPTYASARRAVSEDGRVVAFTSARPMVAGDTNGISDVYRWQETAAGGDLSLISDGSQPPIPGMVLVTHFDTMSPSGGDIVFETPQALVPEDQNGNVDIYDARVEGGFESPPIAPEVACTGQDCQGPVTPPPASPSSGSIGFVGDGNVPPAATRASVDVSRPKAVTGAMVRLKVRVSGAGRISAAGPAIRKANVNASKAGAYSLRIGLNAHAKRSLRKRKKLKVIVRISYGAKDGQSAYSQVKVTFKMPQNEAKSKQGKTQKAR
jgi:hypothetical protein